MRLHSNTMARAWVASSLLILGVIAQQTPLFSPPERRILNYEIDRFVEDLLAGWNSPGGISVAVVQRTIDDTWHVETKGYGNSTATGSRMTPETLFCIASNSKLFTAISAGLLVTNETLSPRISWDTKVADIWPEWQLNDPVATRETTIVDAMSHRTGQPRHDMMYAEDDTSIALLRRLKYLKPSTGFRYSWQYNNNMYTLLSHLPTFLLGVPFAQYVNKHIFVPLGMSSTTYSYEVAKSTGNLADGFVRQGVNRSHDLFDKGTPRAIMYPGWNLPGGEAGSFKSGAGGVITSGNDAAIWLQTLLLGGRNPKTNQTVIPTAVIHKVASGITVANPIVAYPELSPVVYGGGQESNSYRGHAMIEHGGATTGYRTQITRFPFDNFGIAVFSNDDNFGSSLIEIVKYRVIDSVFGLEPIDWDTRMKAEALEQFNDAQSRVVPRPSDPSASSGDFVNLAGKYHNSGYGDIELCLVSAPHSASCRDTLREASTILPGIDQDSPSTFLARWDRFWSSHLLLQHFDGNLFNMSALASRMIPRTREFWTDHVSRDQIITAGFDFASNGQVAGFGFTGIWGAGAGIRGPDGDTAEERAEVWFEKVV
ncbi:beta-lactamase/transpeptidase-like protein [Mycena floridula]|nr:beta-lactamase/transpeptidase-like protein [Mycena floridula]